MKQVLRQMTKEWNITRKGGVVYFRVEAFEEMISDLVLETMSYSTEAHASSKVWLN